MASTTLVTFLFQAPRPVARVELLGSWDNFSKPYPMQRDRGLGNCDWRGCHSFTGIVCDGDALGNSEVRRDGGLKMGGTYWYYYRLDDDSECYNPKEPFTTSCPLLPGQHMNILDVPIQVVYPDSTDNSSVTSLIQQAFTLNPADKFAIPQPPSPMKVKRFRISRSHRSRTISRGESAFSKITRWTKELSLQSRPVSPGIVKCESRIERKCSSAPAESTSWISKATLDPRQYQSAEAHEKPWSYTTDATIEASYSQVELKNSAVPLCSEALSSHPVEQSDLLQLRPSSLSSETRAIAEAPKVDSFAHTHHTNEQHNLDNPDPELRPLREAYDRDAVSGGIPDVPPQIKSTAYSKAKHASEFTTASSSKRTSGVFSLSESMTSYTNVASSQHRHSQPMTPSVSEFGEFILEAFHLHDSAEEGNFGTADLDRRPSGFSGYNLPEAEHASAITLRAKPSPRSERPPLPSTFDNRKLVENWNDGNERNQKSALQDLVDEMGYLSSLIA